MCCRFAGRAVASWRSRACCSTAAVPSRLCRRGARSACMRAHIAARGGGQGAAQKGQLTTVVDSPSSSAAMRYTSCLPLRYHKGGHMSCCRHGAVRYSSAGERGAGAAPPALRTHGACSKRTGTCVANPPLRITESTHTGDTPKPPPSPPPSCAHEVVHLELVRCTSSMLFHGVGEGSSGYLRRRGWGASCQSSLP